MPFMQGYTAEAALCESLGGGKVRCLACAHRCVTAPGGAGRCAVRFNDGGKLRVPRGYVSGLAPDPIEKKPFFHALPGARTLSFGMFGCNFRCSFCQNWSISDARTAEWTGALRVGADRLAAEAVSSGAGVVVSTYNEPLITAEWAAEVFDEAKRRGLRTAFVSNGYATPEAAAFLKPRLDFWKADLKSFDDANYRKVCGAELGKVLDGIRLIKAAGFWLEIVTLLVPGFNDSDAEVSAMAGFIAGLSPDIPWHLTAFHPDHLMTDVPAAPASALYRARGGGLSERLNYV